MAVYHVYRVRYESRSFHDPRRPPGSHFSDYVRATSAAVALRYGRSQCRGRAEALSTPGNRANWERGMRPPALVDVRRAPEGTRHCVTLDTHGGELLYTPYFGSD